jgi:glycosyltransferase involved in cell wall biosynthesis
MHRAVTHKRASQITSGRYARVVIAVDARKYGARDSGIGRYTSSLLDALLRQEGEEVFLSLVDTRNTETSALDDYVRLRSVSVNAPYHSLRAFWKLPRVLQEQGAALFHSHNYHVSPFLPCPLVLTVHDLTPLQYPPRPAARFGKPLLWLLFRMATAKAKRIIVPSQWTSRELQAWLKVPSEKVRVIPEGVDEKFRRRPDDGEIVRVRETYKLPGRFLLYVGRWRPHKNIPTMLRAFQIAIQQTGKDLHLVVAGAYDPQGVNLFGGTDADTAGRIHFTGFVADDDLPGVYAAAAAVVAPSVAEGFGLTALEAMACGTPVVAAKAGALPEVCGDAALLVDPWSAAEMADAFSCVIVDEAIRIQLIERGRTQSRLFTWEKAAHQTLSVYREVLSVGAGSGIE